MGSGAAGSVPLRCPAGPAPAVCGSAKFGRAGRSAPEPAGLGPGSASRLGTGFPPVPRPPLSAAFLPATLTGDGILGSGFFSHPRTPPRHLDLLLLAGIIFYFSIILFVLSPAQRWRCSPGGPKGGAEGAGEGAPRPRRRRARCPAPCGSRGASTGPQLPLAAGGSPRRGPGGPLGRPPPAEPSRPVLSRRPRGPLHAPPPQKKLPGNWG